MRKKIKGQYGGRRKGAGRPPGVRWKLKNGVFNVKQAFVYEPIVIKQFNQGQRRRVKTSRAKIAAAILVHDFRSNKNLPTDRSWYAARQLDEIDLTRSDKVRGTIFYKICKYLEKDKRYRVFLDTMGSSKFPRYASDLERQQLMIPKSLPLSPKLPEKVLMAEYELDQRGRRILPEREWKTAMRKGIAKHREWTQRDISQD